MFKCFSCFKHMLQVFYLDVAYVAMTIYVCCKRMFQMFQLFQTYVANVLSGCCICCNGYTCTLEVYASNVSAVQTYVANVLFRSCICCTGHTRMLQSACFKNVLAVSNVCCKYFIWMLHILQWSYTYVANICL
jgi:hypothetical protein